MIKRNVFDPNSHDPGWVTKNHKSPDAAMRAAKKDSKSGKYSILIVNGTIDKVVTAS